MQRIGWVLLAWAWVMALVRVGGDAEFVWERTQNPRGGIGSMIEPILLWALNPPVWAPFAAILLGLLLIWLDLRRRSSDFYWPWERYGSDRAPIALLLGADVLAALKRGEEREPTRENFNDTLSRARQRALDGHLRIWGRQIRDGKPPLQEPLVLIEREFWRSAAIVLDLTQMSSALGLKTDGGEVVYTDLHINPAEEAHVRKRFG